MRHLQPRKLVMLGAGGAALVLVLTTGLHQVAADPAVQPAKPTAQPASPTAQPSGAPAPASTATTPASISSAAPEAPAEDPTRATIVINTTPAAAANVTWGRKRLGRITPGKPLVVVRPRDSGPLDIMVRAEGYLPVQTRAHTFSDNRVVVKLTPLENIHELLGYRAPLDAGIAPEEAAALDALGASDGGVPLPLPAPLAPAPAAQPPSPGTFQVVPSQPAPLLPLAP